MPNIRPSQVYIAKTQISPQSIAAAGNALSAWIAVPPGSKWAVIDTLTGVLGGGSEQIDVLQATTVGGTGSKALVTNLRTEAVNNVTDQDEVNLDTMDINNGFSFVQVRCTNTGGTGALVAVRVAFGPNEFAA